MRLNDVTLHLRPQSFFQTNTAIAAALYAEARDWIDELAPASAVGPVLRASAASRCTAPRRGRVAVTGIETSVEAVASAEAAADRMPRSRVCASRPATPRPSPSVPTRPPIW